MEIAAAHSIASVADCQPQDEPPSGTPVRNPLVPELPILYYDAGRRIGTMADYSPHDSIRIWLVLALAALLILLFARPASAA
jgi:hypothetical protein